MGNVQSNYYDIQLSEKDLQYHYDVYGAILSKDIYSNISNLQFVIPFKSHNTPLTANKLLAPHQTNTIQVPHMSPI
jgi:hypothetical protein